MAARERTFLGEASLRLSRLLGLPGGVSPQFPDRSSIVPVVLLGDATLPGYGGLSLRRFAGSHQTAAGVGIMSTLYVATADVILLGLQAVLAAVADVTLSYGGPAQALPGAAATADTYFVDRAQAAEPAPLLVGNLDGVAVSGQLLYRTRPTAINVPASLLLGPILLMQGAWLQVRGTTVAVAQSVDVYGMVS